MNITKNKNYLIIMFLILLWNLLLRVYFWPNQQIFGIHYLEALENHLLEYILKTGMKPPMMYFFQGLLTKTFGAEFVLSQHLMLISVIILDFLSFIMLFYVLIVTKSSLSKTIVIVLFYSFYQIPLEFWKLGTHYDSFSLFFNILFIFTIIIFLNNQKTSNGILMSIAGSFLISYGSVFSMVVPITIIVCLFFTQLNYFKFKYFIKLCIFCLILPVITISTICIKNYVYRDIFAPSTFGGVALMLTTMRTVDRNIIKGNKIVEKSIASDWYKWCWKNADRFLPKEWKDDYVAVVNNKVFGQCVKFVPLKETVMISTAHQAHNSHLNDKDLWPLDISELKKYLTLSNAKIPLDAVNKDIDIMINKKYLIHGTTPELSFHWTDLYGKEGSKIFWEDLFLNPSRYLITFSKLFKEFTIDGSQFPLILTQFNERSNFFLNQFSNTFFKNTLRFTGNLIQLILVITFLSYIYLFFKCLLSIAKKNNKILNSYNIKCIIFGCPAILLTILYSTIVGEENSRYLIYALPYFIMSFSYLKPHNIFKKNKYITVLKK